jgi:hypothetical protein
MWCKCQLPLHRGSRHLITSGQFKRHRESCRRLNLPFTEIEAVARQRSHTRANDDDTLDSLSDDSNAATQRNGLYQSDVEQVTDDDDYPDIADWIGDNANNEDSELDPSTRGYGTDARALDMFDAFYGTPRAKVVKMRQAILKHHEVDIGDPIRAGRQAIEDIIGDLVKPIYLHCCADGCVAYTGRLLAATCCPSCGKRRYNTKGEPNYRFQYIPLLPRLRLQYSNAERSQELSSYRASFNPAGPNDGHCNDVFDGDWFRQCWMDGYFHDNRDIALRLTLDAIGVVKHPQKRQLVTPVVLYLLSLPPDTRDDATNALTTHLIPGGYNKEFIDTWLEPLVTELLELHRGVQAYYGASRGDFTMRAHVIMVTGDGPAVADMMGTKSPGKAKQSCRLCSFSGTQGKRGKYYYPNSNNLQPVLHVDMRAQIEQVERHRHTGGSQLHYNNIRRDAGITCRSILMDLPTVHFPRSFPIDIMHSMNHNIPKTMFRLWKAAKYPPQVGQQARRHPWVIPEAEWDLIDNGLLDSRASVPVRVGTAPRSTRSFGNWTTHEWRSHFLTYGAPALTYYLPAEYSTNFLCYRQLLCTTSSRGFTSLEIQTFEGQAVSFVREYERLYYHGDPELLPSCTIQFHYLLHIGQNIRDFGPPLGFAQWSLERFLRTVRIFSTSTAYHHRSAEINLLDREQKLHVQWSLPGQSTLTSNSNMGHAGNTAQLPSKHQLHGRSKATMDHRCQREYERLDRPQEPWYTGTLAADLFIYHRLILPSGAKVGTSLKQTGLVKRNNSLVMYYADAPGQASTVKLSFGVVVVLFKDPGDSTQWAGVARFRSVEASAPLNSPPRPRWFNENDNDLIWISIDRIVDLIGAAHVWYRRGVSTEKSLYIVDKHCFSDVDLPQDVACIGPELAAKY